MPPVKIGDRKPSDHAMRAQGFTELEILAESKKHDVNHGCKIVESSANYENAIEVNDEKSRPTPAVHITGAPRSDI